MVSDDVKALVNLHNNEVGRKVQQLISFVHFTGAGTARFLAPVGRS